MKPEHKDPIQRYGVDRLTLNALGIPQEMVDRIYRALFVYSVGFFELLRKILAHTEKNYSIITAIWKVFSILLEFCCRTDYMTLIQEVDREHKIEIEKLEADYH